MKLYIDSRKRISGTPEDFVYQIPESVDIPESLAYVDCVQVTNGFWTIRQNYNDRIYVRETLPGVPVYQTTNHYRVALIAPGSYNAFSLATAVAAALNGSSKVITGSYACTFNTLSNRLEITATLASYEAYEIYPTGWLKANWEFWNAQSPSTSINGLDSLLDAGAICGFSGETPIATQGDSAVDTQVHHQLFIHSSLGALGDSYGPNGESDIIRRIILDSPQNSITIDRHTTSHDHVRVLRQSLRNIRFRLADIDGRTVSLQGHDWSLSVILFSQ